jgi:hypothetical protein
MSLMLLSLIGVRHGRTDNEYCANPPVISNLFVNKSSGNYIIEKNGFINLTFTSQLDSEQMPLVMYAINWGDDERTVVTGAEMRARPDPANPHSLYHLYDYWDLKAKASQNIAGINCTSAPCPTGLNCCSVRPSVKIKDNWGWCNNGIDGDPCPTGGNGEYVDFGGYVIVTEN